ICCTSANAVRIVNGLNADEIIFAPDRNLAHYVQRFTDKRIIPWDGYCYVHNRITADDVKESRKLLPDAVLMVHPECPPEVIDLADEVQSTGGMVRVAQESKARRFLIGTEEGMITRLKRENPGKEFYSVGPARLCRGMKTIHLKDVRDALEKEQHRIVVPEPVKTRARRALENMLNEG
ncbi:MAG TPA: quinolinate synthase, partial [bacterium]|nr:quinolinate synthase [bacterium]